MIQSRYQQRQLGSCGIKQIPAKTELGHCDTKQIPAKTVGKLWYKADTSSWVTVIQSRYQQRQTVG